MTITNNPSRDEYTATAGQVVFNYTFKIFNSDELDVYVTPFGQEPDDSADLTTDYVVDSGTIGDEDGGFITFNTPLSAGDAVSIVSGIPYDRTVDYQQNGDFLPSTVNNENDRQVAQIKQVLEVARKAVVFGQSSQGTSGLTSEAPEAGKYIRWKNDLSGFENVDLSELPTGIIPADGIAYIFDSVVELVASGLPVGYTAKTKGYYSPGDGGGNDYLIVPAGTGTDDGGSFIDLSEHQAKGLFPGDAVSVRQFGVALDGATDDSERFQAALSYIDSIGGGTLSVNSSGKMFIDSTVTIGASTELTGGVILLSDALGVIEAVNGSGSSIRQVRIEKDDSLSSSIAIYGGGQNGGTTDGFRVIDCVIVSAQNSTGANVASINNIGAPRTEVRGCTITAGHLAFLTKYFTSVDLIIVNNKIDIVPSSTVNNPELLKFEACNGVCSGNIISLSNNASGAVLSCVTFESGVFDFVFEGNVCSSGANPNGFIVRIDNADSPTFPITGLQIQGNRFVGDGIAKRGVQSGDSDNSGIVIRGNDFIDCSLLDVSESAVIDGNYISAGASSTIAGAMSLRGNDKTVKNNIVKAGGAQQCIELTSTATGVMDNLCIEDNVFVGGSTAPVWLKYLSGNSFFVGNTISDTDSGGFGALLLQAGGEAVAADSLIVAKNTIKTTQPYAVKINFMNGVTVYDNTVNGASIGQYQLISTDAVINDFSNSLMPVSTSAQLNSISDKINTEFKERGKAVWDFTAGRPAYASNSTAGAVWVDANGTVVNTPV